MPSTASAPPRDPSARPGYRAVLGAPHAGRTFAAALLGRLSYGVVPLALLLTVREATGSYSAAGAAMALFALASVLLSPVRAGLVDRHGPRRVLPPMAVLYGALLLAVVAATARPGVAPAAVGALVVAAGTCTPPLGPVMRTFWRRLLPDPVLLRRAFSLDGVAEELLFVTGPLLVGLLLPVVGPGGAVVVGAGLLLAGALLLVASPVAAGGPDAPAEADDPDTAASSVAGRRGRRRRTPLGGGRALRAAVLASAVTGLALGALDIMVLAFAEDRGRPEAVGWILAALSAGSAVGGLGLGALDRPVPNAVRLPLFTAGLGLALAAAGLAPGPVLLGVAVGVAGFFVSPALTTSYLVADEAVAPEARTRAGAWVNSAVNAGSAVGGAGGGLLVGHLPLPLCFALAAAPALAAVPVLLRMRDFGGSRSRRKADPVGDPAA
ncbi:MFS transporter [Kitasatospora purpeofusca]|uniref:MFS transporter n=1 Tax=Kitasatospora purpeofusca TaxID=67352 RepID=UPI002253392A|nr:MFS transporter [Kitasatospora purpeofusca]MCX4759183.1 MFS transporter [Kitasatospora purpeofusca]WSR30413.1 MFS transporter [Kitasatospora purpeofusca]WSR38652.1 MFS transporter [Kitasatospora purpeofusca]